MARSSTYPVVVVDWFSRRVLTWRVPITQPMAFCIEALNEALRLHGKPEIFTGDRGAQFTSHDFTHVLRDAQIIISQDRKAAWRDNVFVQRICRSANRRSAQ